MKIEYFETANNLKHNVSGVMGKKVKTHKVKALKSIQFKTKSYPDMKITRLDFCDDKEETIDIDMNFTFEVSKKELFDIMAGIRQAEILWFEDCFPITVKMETHIKNPEKFYWLYAKKLKKNKHVPATKRKEGK